MKLLFRRKGSLGQGRGSVGLSSSSRRMAQGVGARDGKKKQKRRNQEKQKEGEVKESIQWALRKKSHRAKPTR